MFKRNKKYSLVLFSTLILSLILIVACGNKELKQREAFIGFLENQVLKASPLRVVNLNDELKLALGSYADHYQVILDCHDGIGKKGKTFEEEMVKITQGVDFTQLEAAKEAVLTAQKLIVDYSAIIDEEVAIGKEKISKLQQADDLKIVFDKAFEHSVIKSTDTVKSLIPYTQDSLNAQLDLVNFLIAHKDAIEFSGANIVVNDPEVQKQLEPLMNVFNEKIQAYMNAQNEFKKLL